MSAPHGVAEPAVPAARQRSRAPRIWGLSALILVGGLALFAVTDGPPSVHPAWSSWSGWVGMVALFALAEAFVVHIHLGKSAHSISLTDGVVLLSLLHLGHGPTIGAVVLGGCLTLRFLRRQPLLKVVFNGATFVLCSQLAALVLDVGNVASMTNLEAIAFGFIACIVFSVSGSTLVLVVVRVSGETLAASELFPSLLVSALASLATAAVAMATAALASTTPVATPLMLVPFFIGYSSNVIYQRERQRKSEMEFLHRSTEALRHAEATEHTLAALIGNAQRDLRFSHVEVALNVGGTRRHAQSPQRAGQDSTPGLLDAVEVPPAGTADMRNSSDLGDDVLSRAILERGLRSGLVVPVHIPEVVDGVLLIGSEVEGVDAFDTRDLPLAFALAAQIGSLIENERQMASISELRDLERRLVHELQHDPLTGLLNRSAFTRVTRQVINAKAVNGRRWAVAIIDLDDFKNVNDSFGHSAGDAMLVTVGRRIQASIASTESAARLSGDEFAVLFDPNARPETLDLRGRQLLDVIRQPMLLPSGIEVAPRATVGIGVASEGDDLAALLDRADQAMYRAKARGKNAVELIDPHRAGASGRAWELANQLAQNVPLEQFAMAYQPVIDTASGAIVSIEALLRWHHPVHGVLGPDDFLVGLTDGGAAETIDEFVLRSTAEALDRTERFSDVSIAINLGVTQLGSDSFAEVVLRQTAPAHLNRLVLEIPVRALRRSPDAVIRRLGSLRQLGVAVALDDLELDDVPFRLLADLRPSIVKLARGTVIGLSDSAVMPIVRSLAELGEVYGFHLVAKGIESNRDRVAARAVGCSWMQGRGLRAPTTLGALVDDLTSGGGVGGGGGGIGLGGGSLSGTGHGGGGRIGGGVGGGIGHGGGGISQDVGQDVGRLNW